MCDNDYIITVIIKQAFKTEEMCMKRATCILNEKKKWNSTTAVKRDNGSEIQMRKWQQIDEQLF